MEALAGLAMLYGVALWIVFAWGCASIAASKGRSSIRWGVLALAFGPPMVLLVGFIGPKTLREAAGLRS